jgi:hypothetical protein
MSARPFRLEQVWWMFDDALARAPEDQADDLADVGADDPELRGEVEQLLAAEAAAGSFFPSTPVGEVGARGRAFPHGARLGPYEIQSAIGTGGMRRPPFLAARERTSVRSVRSSETKADRIAEGPTHGGR